MGKNVFVSLTERIARVAQYAKNPSMWWNGKEYPWNRKYGRYMRWSMGPNGPYAEEPDFENAGSEESGIFRSGGGVGNTPNPESKKIEKPAPRKKSEYERLYPLFGDPNEPYGEIDNGSEASKSGVGEKPSPPMASNHPTSHKEQDQLEARTAKDFLKVVDVVLSQTLPPDAVEYEKNKTTQFIAGLRTYIKNKIEYDDLAEQWVSLRTQISAVKKQDKGNNDPFYHKLISKTHELQSRAKDIIEQNKPFAQQIATRVQKLSEKERKQNLVFLKKAFPDRGGSSFFEDSFKAEVLEKFRKLGVEKDAQYVFDVYDIIGKSFNIKRKKPKPPTMYFKAQVESRFKKSQNNSENFVASRYDRYGRDGSKQPSISLSIDPKYRGLLMNRLALQLGRWLEQKAVGGDQMKDNLAWLQRGTGDKTVPNYGEVYRIPQKKNPFLCISPDGLAMTIEGPLEYYGDKWRERTTHPTEVFSTGMQWLAIYPEMFAKQSPRHFTQILKNLRMISVKGKR